MTDAQDGCFTAEPLREMLIRISFETAAEVDAFFREMRSDQCEITTTGPSLTLRFAPYHRRDRFLPEVRRLLGPLIGLPSQNQLKVHGLTVQFLYEGKKSENLPNEFGREHAVRCKAEKNKFFEYTATTLVSRNNVSVACKSTTLMPATSIAKNLRLLETGADYELSRYFTLARREVVSQFEMAGSAQQVLSALTEKMHFSRWWNQGHCQVTLHESGDFTIAHSHGGGAADFQRRAFTANERVEWFCPRSSLWNSPAWEGTRIRFSVEKVAEAKSLVKFAQTGFASQEYALEALDQWEFALKNNFKPYYQANF